MWQASLDRLNIKSPKECWKKTKKISTDIFYNIEDHLKKACKKTAEKSGQKIDIFKKNIKTNAQKFAGKISAVHLKHKKGKISKQQAKEELLQETENYCQAAENELEKAVYVQSAKEIIKEIFSTDNSLKDVIEEITAQLEKEFNDIINLLATKREEFIFSNDTQRKYELAVKDQLNIIVIKPITITKKDIDFSEKITKAEQQELLNKNILEEKLNAKRERSADIFL